MSYHSEQINELAAALAKAQAVMENATLNQTNPHFKSRYADLASVLDAIRIPLAGHGIAIVQTIHSSTLRTTLIHTSGQWISSEYPLPTSGTPQQMGSALTYARRYSLSAMTGIAADDDDDANAAQATTKRAAPKPGPNVIGVIPQGYKQTVTKEDDKTVYEHIPAPSQPDAVESTPQQEPAADSVTRQWRAHPMPRIATEGFEVASKGLVEYERWWVGLTLSERKQLLPYHEMIKDAAAEADRQE